MELYQATIFGDCQKVIEKHNPEHKPKKLSKKNRELKQKLEILYDLYYKLYELQNISILEQREIIKKGDIIVHVEDRQAEPIEIGNMNVLDDIDKRIEATQERLKDYECEQLQFEFMKDYKNAK